MTTLKDAEKLHNNPPAAIRAYMQILAANPNCHTSLNNASVMLIMSGRPWHAIKLLKQLLESGQMPLQAHTNLAAAYYKANKLLKAKHHLNMAQSIDPNHKASAQMLADIATETSPYSPVKISPMPLDRLIHSACAISPIYNDNSEIEDTRTRIKNTLDAAHALIADGHRVENPTQQLNCSPFYLAYHGLNDKDLLTSFNSAIYNAMPTSLDQYKQPINNGSGLAFISCNLHNHSVGIAFQKIIQKLSEKIPTTIFYIGNKYDKFTLHFAQNAKLVILPRNLALAAKTIKAANVHHLIYTDIGMDPFTSLLANLRLAPIQSCLAGHPTTTGIKNIDNYVSSTNVEPHPDIAKQHYSENLVLVDGTFPVPDIQFNNTKTRQDLGLPSSPLFCIPMSLQKLHHDTDKMIDALCSRMPTCKIMIFSMPEHLQPLVKARMEKNIPQWQNNIVWTPKLPHDDLMQVMNLCDAVLDTPHFGGGTTLFYAIAANANICSFRNAFMRGKTFEAFCSAMQLPNFTWTHMADYAHYADKLANDPHVANYMRSIVVERKHKLFTGTYYNSIESWLMQKHK